jgi:hypothetical protein
VGGAPGHECLAAGAEAQTSVVARHSPRPAHPKLPVGRAGDNDVMATVPDVDRLVREWRSKVVYREMWNDTA